MYQRSTPCFYVVCAALLVSILACASATPRRDPEALLDSVIQIEDMRLYLKPGNVPYANVAPGEFSDHALKLTAVRLPDGGTVTLASSDNQRPASDLFRFPIGTLISKTFFYPAPINSDGCESGRVMLSGVQRALMFSEIDLDSHCLIETRLLLRNRDGWLTYVFTWVGNEAIYEPGGRVRQLEGVRPSGEVEAFEYLIPSLAQCGSCHHGSRNSAAMAPIGINVHRLTRASSEDLLSAGNPAHLATAQIEMVNLRREQLGPARNYLDANCGYCHNPHGLAASSGLFLDRYETDPVRLGRCKPPVAMGKQVAGASVDIHPSYAERSLIYRRMQSVQPGVVMPELGRSLPDYTGLEVVKTWIDQMPGGCE